MKKYLTTFLLGLLITTVSNASTTTDALPAFTAQYDLFHNNTKLGSSTKQLVYSPSGKYTYTAHTNINVFMVHKKYIEHSDGTVDNSGFTPQYYSLSTDNKINYQTTDFHGAQDNLSQELMLRYFLLKNITLPTLSVVTVNGTEQFAFKMIQADEMVASTIAGDIPATHVQFFDRDGNQIDEWLAKKYAYLPVVIKISTNGVLTSAIYLTAITN